MKYLLSLVCFSLTWDFLGLHFSSIILTCSCGNTVVDDVSIVIIKIGGIKIVSPLSYRKLKTACYQAAIEDSNGMSCQRF